MGRRVDHWAAVLARLLVVLVIPRVLAAIAWTLLGALAVAMFCIGVLTDVVSWT
jgi:hypothetical protein